MSGPAQLERREARDSDSFPRNKQTFRMPLHRAPRPEISPLLQRSCSWCKKTGVAPYKMMGGERFCSKDCMITSTKGGSCISCGNRYVFDFEGTGACCKACYENFNELQREMRSNSARNLMFGHSTENTIFYRAQQRRFEAGQMHARIAYAEKRLRAASETVSPWSNACSWLKSVLCCGNSSCCVTTHAFA